MDAADRKSNSSDGSFDLVGSTNSDAGLAYVSTGRSKKKDKRKSKKGKSDDIPNAYDYGSHYVLPPKPTQVEEQDPLVPSNNARPDDPLSCTTMTDREEFEDELDDVEMREEKNRNFENFGETEKKQPLLQAFQVYAIPVLVGILFLLGLVAAVLYLAGVGKNTAKIEQEVPKPPEDLSLMCYDSNPSLATDIPTLCEDYCRASQCCWDPKGKYTCGEGTETRCPDYIRECGPWKNQLLGISNSNSASSGNADSIPQEMRVPPIVAGLHTECERTFTDTVSDACKAGCAAADCCWNKRTTTICTADTVENCVDYKDACDFLNEELENIDVGFNGDVSDVDWATIPFPQPPVGLSIYCDPSEMEEISLHICEDKCNDAECCWKNGVESCISKYPAAACHEYTQSCGILNNLATAPDNSFDVTSSTPPDATLQSNSNTLQEAPSNLAETCSKDRISDSDTGGEALIQCEEECLKGSCCWQPNAALPCTDDPKCTGYASCDIFATLFDKPEGYTENQHQQSLAPLIRGTVPDAASDINDVCSPDVLTTRVNGGKSIVECEKECLVGACCWKKNHPSHCPDAYECADYMTPCGTNLVNALLTLENSNPVPFSTPPPTLAPVFTPAPTPAPQPVIQTVVPEAPGTIGLFCNPDVLKLTVDDGDFIIECEKICLEAACCWKEGHATVCPDAPECDAYLVPCKDNLVPVLDQMEGGTAGGGSPATPSTAATPAPAPSIPVAPDDMNIRCSVENLTSNPEGRGNCEDACSLAECCWNFGVADCIENTLCVEYQPCENLLNTNADADGASSVTPPSPPEDLADTCKADNLLDLRGLNKCRVVCEAASCCWTNDSILGSCTTAVECRTYEDDCSLMRTMLLESLGAGENSGTNPAATESIESACDTTTTFYLRSRCEQACSPGQCCLEGTDCEAGIDCLDYTACNVLLGIRRMLRHGGDY